MSEKLRKSLVYEGQTTIEELEHRIALHGTIDYAEPQTIMTMDIQSLVSVIDFVLQRLQRIDDVSIETYYTYLQYGFDTTIGRMNMSQHSWVNLGKR